MKLPLYVDLDGTLIRGDTMQQAAVTLLRRNPLRLATAAHAWVTRGRPAGKAMIASAIDLDPKHFHYHADVLAYIDNARAQGRRVVLATGSHEKYAQVFADHLGRFDAVYATTADGPNLTAENKLAAIQRDAGDAFEYLGDSRADLVVFEKAAVSGWVGGKALGLTVDGKKIHRLGADPDNQPRALLQSMRPHQWTKNLLVLLPVLTSHRWGETHLVLHALAAMAALCLVASGTYILNDLLDLNSDQKHADKRNRAIAAGRVSIAMAIKLSGALLLAGLVVAGLCGGWSLALISGYLLLTLAYSLSLKKRLLIDAIALASLYVLRPILGGKTTGIELSEWLIVFCAFFFTSLAFLKRFTELKPHVDSGQIEQLPGRGYQPQDILIVQIVGPAMGIAAVLVIAMYVNSPIVTTLYQHPQWLWAWCPLIGYWIVRSWMLANRGTLHHDPVVFAFTDSRSYGVILLMAVAALLAVAKVH